VSCGEVVRLLGGLWEVSEGGRALFEGRGCCPSTWPRLERSREAANQGWLWLAARAFKAGAELGWKKSGWPFKAAVYNMLKAECSLYTLPFAQTSFEHGLHHIDSDRHAMCQQATFQDSP
jgi:hypothetical protein